MRRLNLRFSLLSVLVGVGIYAGAGSVHLDAAALATEDFVFLPLEFDIPDFKFRADQESQIRSILKHDAANRGEQWDETLPAHLLLSRALDRGPSPLVSLLASPDEYLLEVALDGLAIRFGPNAGSAVPQILKVWDHPKTDDRTKQLVVRCLERVAAKEPAVLAEVMKRAAKVPVTAYALRCAIVDFLASYGPAASKHVPWLEGETQSLSGRVQYQAMLALARIEPVPVQDPARWAEPGQLASLKPSHLSLVENHIRKEGDRAKPVFRELIQISGEDAPKYRRVVALKSLASLQNTDDDAASGILVQGITDEDEFLQRNAIDAILSLSKPPLTLIPSLVELLEQGNAPVRMRVAGLLKRFGPDAAPASAVLARILKHCTDRTPETEIAVYLQALKAMGPAGAPAADALVELLPEQSLILKNRSKLRIHHIRGFIMVTLAEIGVPKKGLPFIVDSLANSPRNMPYAFASAARAAASMGPQARVCVPYLLRALQGELDDDYLSFESLNTHKSSDGEYTTSRLEAIRALGRIGSNAREAIPLLQELVNQPAVNLSVSGRLYKVPSLVEEARKALKSIQS